MVLFILGNYLIFCNSSVGDYNNPITTIFHFLIYILVLPQKGNLVENKDFKFHDSIIFYNAALIYKSYCEHWDYQYFVHQFNTV